MSITGTIAAVAGIGSSIAGGVMQGNAASDAADAQQQYAQQAQQLEQQNQQKGVDFQTGEWTTQQANEQPFLLEGQTSANNLSKLLSTGFTAPTLAQAQQTPGYQFNLQTGTQAINENAAATGNLMSGNTGTALEKFGQGLATTTYQQAYNNALNGYMANEQSLLAGTNVGLTSAGQLGQQGQAAANNLSNLYLTGGQQQAQQLNNQGSAIAAGDVGQANAYSNMLNGATNSLTQGMLLSNGIYPGSGGGGFLPGVDSGTYGSAPFVSGGSLPPPNPYANNFAPYTPMNLPGVDSSGTSLPGW